MNLSWSGTTLSQGPGKRPALKQAVAVANPITLIDHRKARRRRTPRPTIWKPLAGMGDLPLLLKLLQLQAQLLNLAILAFALGSLLVNFHFHEKR
jgi:hypothetical protein